MKPQEALRILIGAAELAPLPKKDHVVIEQAINVLVDAIKAEPANSSEKSSPAVEN